MPTKTIARLAPCGSDAEGPSISCEELNRMLQTLIHAWNLNMLYGWLIVVTLSLHPSKTSIELCSV